jgi:hypothetical protein
VKLTPEQLDAWRAVPRLLVLLYGWLCFDTHQWYTSLADPTTPQQLYASVIWTAAAAWFGFYVNSGRRQE